MKNEIIHFPTIKKPIQPDPGFRKKLLADFHLDLLALCQFLCIYCSSNFGQYVRTKLAKMARLASDKLGRPVTKKEALELTFAYENVLSHLTNQLNAARRSILGAGKTLVVSMRTDAFSPLLVLGGETRKALELVLEKTAFRIRILTKNSVVGSASWISFFKEHRDRFVVGLSIGTDDDAWARVIERGTPPPSRRLAALHRLQDAGIPTYGMLCPVFPGVLEGDRLERLLDLHRPSLVEHVWFEPYNDRVNWKLVRAAVPDARERTWLDVAFGNPDSKLWSWYATELYTRVIEKAEAEGWADKVRYLLYENNITDADATAFVGLRGVLLQSPKDEDGRSRHPVFARYQTAGRK